MPTLNARKRISLQPPGRARRPASACFGPGPVDGEHGADLVACAGIMLAEAMRVQWFALVGPVDDDGLSMAHVDENRVPDSVFQPEARESWCPRRHREVLVRGHSCNSHTVLLDSHDCRPAPAVDDLGRAVVQVDPDQVSRPNENGPLGHGSRERGLDERRRPQLPDGTPRTVDLDGDCQIHLFLFSPVSRYERAVARFGRADYRSAGERPMAE